MVLILITSLLASNKYPQHTCMMRKVRKRPLCYLEITQAQISLRISGGWSGPSLSAYRNNGYCSICERTGKAHIRLNRYAHWSGPTLSAKCIRALFMRLYYQFSWINKNTSIQYTLLPRAMKAQKKKKKKKKKKKTVIFPCRQRNINKLFT